MRVALLGLGLIGGSVARGLARSGQVSVAAWSPSGRGPAAALAEGVVDAAPSGPGPAIEGAELVVLAAPPLACLEMLSSLAGGWRGSLRADATVTDVASTKASLVARADQLGLPFVGGHPMAGRESSGYEAATADLFVDRPWVVVPGESARGFDIERVESLARALGARAMRMAAGEHDAAMAAISHLPLLASAALVEAAARGAGRGGPDLDVLGRLAATGWRDTTRLARGDAEMGAGILATNAGPVSVALAWLLEVLEGWAAELDLAGGPDAAEMRDRLAAAGRALATMDRAAGTSEPAAGSPVDRTGRS